VKPVESRCWPPSLLPQRQAPRHDDVDHGPSASKLLLQAKTTKILFLIYHFLASFPFWNLLTCFLFWFKVLVALN